MATLTRIIPNTYRDSVSLMQLSSRLAEAKGVEQVSVVMATAANLDLLREAKLLDRSVEARASDLLALVLAQTSAIAQGVLDEVERALKQQLQTSSIDAPGAIAPRSIAMAHVAAPEANLALISVPGEFAAAETQKALDAGLNVMLFSDNVTLEDEVALKHQAGERGLLLMGPDCGTAIIDGVPLGFANEVRRGSVGCIGASGTGLQEVTSLIDQLGQGVSQAIGTGGRDLSAAVGGATMLAAIGRLARDRDTKVIVLIAKPPDPEVAKKVLVAAAKARKPVVVCFVGAAVDSIRGKNLHGVATLEAAARAAVALLTDRGAQTVPATPRVRVPSALPFASSQKFIRGLYSGGTFCYEASMLLDRAFTAASDAGVWSNAAIRADRMLPDPWQSREHTLIDLGDDVFTRGRPHPMIDHRLRNERIVREAADATVAVILLDVVLGFGSHADPVAAMLPAIRAAQAKAKKGKRAIAFVAFVCGTERDPQGLARQQRALREAGVVVAPSNAQAVEMAMRLVHRATKKAGANPARRKAMSRR